MLAMCLKSQTFAKNSGQFALCCSSILFIRSTKFKRMKRMYQNFTAQTSQSEIDRSLFRNKVSANLAIDSIHRSIYSNYGTTCAVFIILKIIEPKIYSCTIATQYTYSMLHLLAQRIFCSSNFVCEKGSIRRAARKPNQQTKYLFDYIHYWKMLNIVTNMAV